MVAEGVEYGYQQQWLGKNNVDYLQGYQFLPPVTFDDFMRYYKQSLDFLNQRRILLSQRKAFREHQGRMPLMQVFLSR